MSVINVDFMQDVVIATYNIPAIMKFPPLMVELMQSSNGSRKFNVVVQNTSPSPEASYLQSHPFYISVISPWLDNGVIPSIDDEENDTAPAISNVLSMADYKERHVR